MEIFIRNLPSTVSTSQLTALFQQYGQVASARVITDKFSGLSRGFGFVNMPKREEALSAIKTISGQDFQGNKLDVSEARTQSRMRRSKRETP